MEPKDHERFIYEEDVFNDNDPEKRENSYTEEESQLILAKCAEFSKELFRLIGYNNVPEMTMAFKAGVALHLKTKYGSYEEAAFHSTLSRCSYSNWSCQWKRWCLK